MSSNTSYTKTSTGEPRGYINFLSLKQLWIHTGTVCNLECPSCFEGSSPRSKRLQTPTLEDVIPYIDKAIEHKVESFGFTGGEPFMNPHMIKILDYALSKAPCLVLTNGTKPIIHYLPKLKTLLNKEYSLTFRISLNAPDREIHDAERGKGSFQLSLDCLKSLYDMGFSIAVARHIDDNENTEEVLAKFQSIFRELGIPETTTVVGFPDLEREDVPEISENCIKTYHTPESCSGFMCATTRMLVKKNGALRIFSCTLVDDSPFYDLGDDLELAINQRTWLAHKRCFSCFSSGVSCGQV